MISGVDSLVSTNDLRGGGGTGVNSLVLIQKFGTLLYESVELSVVRLGVHHNLHLPSA